MADVVRQERDIQENEDNYPSVVLSPDTQDRNLAPIHIYNPTEIPYGALSNNLIQYITVKRRRYPSVTNFIYSNCVDFGANKEILRNASTKRPTKKINIEAKLDYLMMNYEAINKKAMNPSEIASLKRSLLLSVDAKHLSVYETFIKTLNEERSVYCVEALTTLFQHYSGHAENWLSVLTSTEAKDIYYVIDSSQSNEEQALNSILGVDSRGIGDNVCGKMLMEIRNNVYRKHLSQRGMEEERMKKEMVFAKFLAVVAFLKLLKNGELPSANNTVLVERMNSIRETGYYKIDVVYKMFLEGRLTEIEGIDDVPMDALLIPNIVKQLFQKYRSEIQREYNKMRIEIVWKTFLREVIKEKHPNISKEELEKNVLNYGGLVLRSDHDFFEIIDGDKKMVVSKTNLFETMKNLIYVTYLQNKLPTEIQQKIDEALKEIGHQYNEFPIAEKEKEKEAEDKNSSSSSSSSSSDDNDIKRTLRDDSRLRSDVSQAFRQNEESLRSKIEALTSSPSILAGLSSKSQLEMERIYRKLLYQELGIPIPYRENITEMLADIKKLGGKENFVGNLETVRDELSLAMANAKERDRALIKEINAKLRISYSIYELEQKLKVMRARKQVEGRADLKDIHEVIRAEKKHGEREHLLLPLYEESLQRGTFENSVKVFHDVSKNTDSLALLSLLHKQTPIFKGEVRVSNEGYPIVRGYENGMEYLMCYLMSKIKMPRETADVTPKLLERDAEIRENDEQLREEYERARDSIIRPSSDVRAFRRDLRVYPVESHPDYNRYTEDELRENTRRESEDYRRRREEEMRRMQTPVTEETVRQIIRRRN